MYKYEIELIPAYIIKAKVEAAFKEVLDRRSAQGWRLSQMNYNHNAGNFVLVFEKEV